MPSVLPKEFPVLTRKVEYTLIPCSAALILALIGVLIQILLSGNSRLSLVTMLLVDAAFFLPALYSDSWKTVLKKLGWFSTVPVLITAVVVLYAAREARRAAELRPFSEQISQYLDVSGFQVRSGPAYLTGKVLLIDTAANKVDDLFFDLPADLRAHRSDEVGTIVWIHCAEEWVSLYPSDNRWGYQTFCRLTVIDKTNATILGKYVIAGFGPLPENKAPGDQPSPRPEDEILEYILSLPRR
jgi:hypothetical protein